MIAKIQPIFILGNPRSGTSLFRLILNSHRNIVAAPECGFSHWLMEKYMDWTEKDVPGRIGEFIEDVQKSKKFETWDLPDHLIKKIIKDFNPKNYADLVKCVYISYASHPNNVEVVADKNNYYIDYIEDLHKIWPKAKYIHLIRDVRDVACSYLDIKKVDTPSLYIPKLPTELKDISREWKLNNHKIRSIKSREENDYYLIKYEDLIKDTEMTLKGLMNFLELPFDKDMLNYYMNSSANKMEPKETLAWKEKTKEKPDKEKIGRYKNYLTEEEIARINLICAEELKLYNYES